MAQPTNAPTSDQLADIVDTAAVALIGGSALDDMARFQAAGCAVKLANDNNEDDLLNLVILVSAGHYEHAAAALMKFALSQGGSQSAPAFDPLAGILNNPAPAAAPTSPPAGAPAQPADPTATNTGGRAKPGRRGQR